MLENDNIGKYFSMNKNNIFIKKIDEFEKKKKFLKDLF